jgi:hypothetical protein
MPTYTPAWARPAGTTDKAPPTNPADFASFAAAAVRHFAPMGVNVWEIWNEPNLAQFWSPRPDVAAYTRLLVGAHDAIKAVDPSATVLTGGLSPAVDAGDGSTISPISFVRGMYGAGAKDKFDAVGIHPYSFPFMPMDPTTTGWNTFIRMPLVHDIMAAQGDGAKKIWMTEFGAPTGTNRDAVTEAKQAQIITEAYRAIRQWPWAGPLFWYAPRDSGTDPANRDENFGILRADGSRKASWSAMASVLAEPVSGVFAAPASAASLSPASSGGSAGVPATAGGSAFDGYRLIKASAADAAFGATSTIAPQGAGTTVVGAAATPSGNGYWAVTDRGRVVAFGDAPALGGLESKPLNQPIVGMAGTPSGRGYWLVARDGGIFSYGDAAFYGSTGAMRLNQPIVGMTSSPTGRGYQFVAADGGVFSFGDAAFYGSTGAMRLNQPIVGMATTRSGRGYWLVARDGGIFSFGDAAFFGSTGAMRLNQPIIGMARSRAGGGYRMVASDGGVFSFGDATFLGSAGGQAGNRIVAMLGGS